MAAAAKTSKKPVSKTAKTAPAAKVVAKKVTNASSKRSTARAVASKTKTAVAAATKSSPAKAASKKAAPKVTDPRRTAFVRLAEGRTSQAIKQIRLLGNLSNLSAYDFSQSDIQQIMKSLQDEIAATMARFETSLANATLKRERKFKLGGFEARA